MGAHPTETAATPSATDSVTMQNTASRETTLTARAFMRYLDDQQREQILGEGLELNKLTRAQQITVLKVLETLLNENAYRTISAVLDHINTTPDAEPHYLKFSTMPTTDGQWKLELDGPMLGLHAWFAEDGDISLESAHFILNSDDVNAISFATADETGTSPISSVNTSAFDLFNSLTAEQRAALMDRELTGSRGLRGSDLSDYQREMLIDATTNWICLGDKSTVVSKQNRIAETLDETYFSLSDIPGADPEEGLTFQVTGPEVFIKFSETPTEFGAFSVESVFEDPSI